VKRVFENNVRLAFKNIRDKSPLLIEMEDKGEVKIIGAFYGLTDSTLAFIQ